MAIAIPNISPADLLGRVRGTIIRAVPGYPEVIHLRIEDAEGGVWRFSTFYCDFSPSDPDFFLGKVVVDIDSERSGKLKMRFADGSEFNVAPEPEGPDDELTTWHLLTPDGLALWFRPRGLWDLEGQGDGLLEDAFDLGEELGAVGSVEDPVVAAEGDFHQLAGDDLAVLDDRLVGDLTDGEDSRLG